MQISVAVGVLERSGLLLVARRRLRNRSFPHHWEFPGGKNEPGEDWAAAVRREWKEECLIDVSPVEVFLQVPVLNPFTGDEFNISAGFIRTLETPRLGAAHDRLLWVTPKEALRLVPSTPSTHPIVRRVVEALASVRPNDGHKNLTQ